MKHPTVLHSDPLKDACKHTYMPEKIKVKYKRILSIHSHRLYNNMLYWLHGLELKTCEFFEGSQTLQINGS